MFITSFLKILWVHLLQTKERRRILRDATSFEAEMRKNGKRLWTDSTPEQEGLTNE